MDFKPMAEEVFDTLEDTDDDELGTEEPLYIGDEQPEKTVTLRQVLEAVRANGIPHVRGIWFETGDYKPTDGGYYEITGGCAVAQAARNLGIDPHYIEHVPAIGNIIALNDDENRNLTLDEIADEIAALYADELDDKYVARVADYSHGVPAYVNDQLTDA